MSSYLFKGLLFLALVIFGTNSYANGPKGYKIILASFPNFDEAKSKMELLRGELTQKDWEIQKEYGYAIVARPSGNVFIVAIEPLDNKEAVNYVIERFKKFHPDAYANGYFGPTKGAVVLTPPLTKITKENTVVQKNPTLTPPLEKTSTQWEVLAALLGLVGVGIFLTRMRKRTQQNTNSLVETIERKLNVIPEDADIEIRKSEPVKITQEDIFYTLKRNRFFSMLLDELQKASITREEQQCHDLIREMRRYEKKFQSSSIISEMEELAFAKKFRELSEFITHQNNGN